MRVIWITPGFAADEHDHNCIPPLQLLAKELLRQGVDLQIIALEYPFRSEPYQWRNSSPLESLSRDFGRTGEAMVFPCNGQNRRWLKWRTLWKAIETFRKLSTFGKFGGRNEVAAIHSFWLGWASFVGEKMAQKHSVQHFTTLMGQDVLPENRNYFRQLTAKRATRLVAVSDFQNGIFEKNTDLRAANIIPWGVAESEIPTLLPAERPLDALGVGSFVPVKNWEKWLRTIAKVVENQPDLKTELVGDGPERAKLERLTQQLNLNKNVCFVGGLPRSEVLKKMQKAKVLLHTAGFESFGYVLAEAAMSGCRVVGTPVGIASQLGWTAEKEADLAVLVLEILNQPVQNQAFVPFTMKETAEAYLRLYKNYFK